MSWPPHATVTAVHNTWYPEPGLKWSMLEVHWNHIHTALWNTLALCYVPKMETLQFRWQIGGVRAVDVPFRL